MKDFIFLCVIEKIIKEINIIYIFYRDIDVIIYLFIFMTLL